MRGDSSFGSHQATFTAAVVGSIGLLLLVALAISPDLAAVVAGVVLVTGIVVWRRASVLEFAFTAAWSLSVFSVEIDSSSGAYGRAEWVKYAPMLVLALLAGWMLLTGTVVWGISRPLWSAMIYVGWLWCAAAASGAPEVTVLRAIQATLPVLCAIVVVRYGLRIWPLVYGTMVACGAHVVYALVNPKLIGLEGALRVTGLVIANTLGFASGTLAMIGVAMWLSVGTGGLRPLIAVTAIALGGWGIVISVGRTGSIAVVVATIGMLIAASLTREHRSAPVDRKARLRGRRLRITWLVAILVVIGVLSDFDALLDWFSTGNTEIGSLTGRTDLWSDLVPLVTARPVIGYGPGGMRFRLVGLSEALGERVSLGQAHNAVFEAALAAGLVGAALWLYLMMQMAKGVMGADRDHFILGVGLWLGIAVSSLTLGNFAGFGIGWYVLCVVLMISSQSGVASARHVSIGRSDAMISG